MTGPLSDLVRRARQWWNDAPPTVRQGAMSLGIIIVAAVAFVSLRAAFLNSFGPPSHWASFDVIDSREPLQEVPVRPVRDRYDRDDTATVLDMAGLNRFVIGIDLDYLDRMAMSYELMIKDFADDVVWSEEVPEEFLSDGRALVRLMPGRFDEGVYAVEIEAYESDGSTSLVARGTFEVIK